MRIGTDCIACAFNHAVSASKIASEDLTVQNSMIKDILITLSNFESYTYAPELFKMVHVITHNHSGNKDIYRSLKDLHIRKALDIYPLLEAFVQSKEDPLYWSTKTAAAGNIIDLGVYSEIDFLKTLEEELNKEFSVNNYTLFKQSISKAKKLLIIADNAGETVFDRILIKALKGLDITYAVRDVPIINDATIEDAYASEITGVNRIISSGSTIPGTIISDCSQEFQQIFYDSDVVISKGLGNFETLPKNDREIFFVFKAKCPRIAHLFNIELGGYVLKSSQTCNQLY